MQWELERNDLEQINDFKRAIFELKRVKETITKLNHFIDD